MHRIAIEWHHINALKILESRRHIDRPAANHMTVGQNNSFFSINNKPGCRADSLIGFYEVSHIGNLQRHDLGGCFGDHIGPQRIAILSRGKPGSN